MSTLIGFKAWRPKPEFVQEVISVPYDIINTAEARDLAQGKPNSYLHVIRPEIDLPKNTSVYDEKVYVKGRDNLIKLLQSKVMLQEDEEALYIYRIEINKRTHTGIFGCVSVDDYNKGRIVKHELTRFDKEDYCTKHIIAQKTSEPVMLTLGIQKILLNLSILFNPTIRSTFNNRRQRYPFSES